MRRTTVSSSWAPGRAATARSSNSARRVGNLELVEQVDALGGDRQRRTARGEHAQVGGRRDEERHQLGDRADEVLAVVEHEQARRLREPLRDAAAEVGALLGREVSAAADRVAHAQDRADLGDDVLGRGHADELDDVHDRLRRVAREHVRQARLAQAAGADDRHHARGGDQPAQRLDVAVAAEQRRRVVADAGALGPVERQQVALRALEALAGAGAEPLAQVSAVALVALERGAGPAHDRLAAQQVGQQGLVVRVCGVGSLEGGHGVGVRAQAAGGPREDGPRLGRVDGGGLADLRQQRAVVPVGGLQPARQRQRLAGKRLRVRRVAVQRRGRVADERGEPAAVDLARADAQAVAARVAEDGVGAVGRARARHQHLQALRGVGGGVLAPHELDQPLVGDRPSAAGRQRRQQRARALAGDGRSPPPHILEQGQGDSHPASLSRRVGRPEPGGQRLREARSRFRPRPRRRSRPGGRARRPGR